MIYFFLGTLVGLVTIYMTITSYKEGLDNYFKHIKEFPNRP